MPKHFKQYVLFTLAVLVCLRLAGPQVREWFMTSFAGEEKRDPSAQSRLRSVGRLPGLHQTPSLGWSWSGTLALESRGVIPLAAGQAAHTLWLQLGAELGLPALFFLLSFYLLCVARLYGFLLAPPLRGDPWLQGAARMVIVSIAGFMVAAQFVSLWAWNCPTT